MKKIAYIYLDDERVPSVKSNEDVEVILVRNYDDAVEAFSKAHSDNRSIFLDLDHDLGTKESGYDFCKYAIRYAGEILGYKIHSMNPIGRANMEQLLNKAGVEKYV